jgi:hypothetical protein
MRWVWRGYRGWVLKRAKTAQCSPALMVLGMIVVACIVAYVYREIIIHTLIMAGIAVGIVCGTAVIVAFTVNFLRWSRRQQVKRVDALIAASQPDGEPQDTVPGTVTEEDAKAISEEADWLASGVELAFGPDGSLKTKKG